MNKKLRLIGQVLAVTVMASTFSDGPAVKAENRELYKEIAANIEQSQYTVINVTDFGADPTGRVDSTEAINKAIEYAKTIEGPKKIYFQKGEYQLYPEKAPKRELYVSNTAGADQRYKIKNIGILVEDVDDLVIDGGGSQFIYHGFQTAFASIRSKNVRFENFSFDYVNPKVVDVTVEETGTEDNSGYRVLYIPETYDYKIENNGINWYGEKSPVTGQYYWTGRNSFNYTQYYDATTGNTRRSGNNLFSNVKTIEELGDNRVKITYNSEAAPSDIGRVYQMRETTRDTPGAFFWESKDVTVKSVNAQYLHGFGFVGQLSENITVDNVDFSPRIGNGRVTGGFADYIQMSGVKGKVKIMNTRFSNPHDDPINIHGTYLEVVEKLAPNKFKVRYMHNETAGFPQFYVGDEVEFFAKQNMLAVEGAKAKVIDVDGPSGQSSDKNLTDIIITLDKDLPDDVVAGNTHVVENISYTPEVEIINNRFENTPTRGILVTTRKPVLIENNYFDSMGMSSIYISSDAHQWYESGPTNDVTIRNNVFDRCDDSVINFDPTNQQFNENRPVHNNILIEDNIFNIKDRPVLRGKSVGNVLFRNNTINRYTPNTSIKIDEVSETMKVGEMISLPVNKTGNTLGSALFDFNGSNDITIENNKYDNGLNLRINTANMANPANNITIVGDNLKINSDNRKDGAGTVRYYSSDENVIKTDSDGNIYAVGEGTATIKAFVTSETRAYESNSITITVSGTASEIVTPPGEDGEPVLSHKWNIVRENESNWSLNKDGSLNIQTAPGILWATSNNAQNVFLTDIGELATEDYTVTTKVIGKTNEGYEEAGIIIYKDDDNYVTIQRKHNNGDPKIRVVTEKAGSPNESREVNNIDENEVYFKLEKTGDVIKGYYSLDEKEWIEVGNSLTNSGVASGVKVGILTANPTGSNPFVFSDFKVNGEKIDFKGEKEESNGGLLTGLRLNGASLNEELNDNTVEYSAGVAPNVESVSLDLTAASNSKIEVFDGEELLASSNGSLYTSILTDGWNEKAITVKVTSQDGEAKTYTLRLNKFLTSDALLKNIVVEGVEGMPTFSENNFYYMANGSTTSNSMRVIAEAKESTSKLSVWVNGKLYENVEGPSFDSEISLVSGINTVQIYSVAEDGISKAVYRLSVVRRESNEAKLKSIKLNDQLIDGFADDKFAYSTKVGEDVQSIKLAVEKANGNSSVQIYHNNNLLQGDEANIDLLPGSNSIVVKVTSENFAVTNYYRIVVNKKFEGNATLESLEFKNGIEINPEFDPNITNYSVVAPKDTNLVTLVAKAAEDKAEVSIAREGEEVNYKVGNLERNIYLEAGQNNLIVSVKAEDGTVKEYKIGVYKSVSLEIPKSQMTATATSQETSGENGSAANVLDNNTGTIWHTKYSGGQEQLPQSLTINLGGEYLINEYQYLPRQGGGSNGNITKYELYTSTDGKTFTKISEGSWDKNAELKKVTFDPTLATHVKLVALQGVGGFASASEMNILEYGATPEAPVDLTCTEKTEDSVTIGWSIPEAAQGVTGYVLFKDGEVVTEVDKNTLSYKFQELTKSTEYTFEVASRNKQGELSERVSIKITTEGEIKSADMNNDGVVDISDLAIVSKYFGQNKEEYDLNGDAIVGEYEINFITSIILGQ